MGSGPIHSILYPYWIEFCFWVTTDKDYVTIHKIIPYYLNQFPANVPFPCLLKTSKNLGFFYVHMGYKYGTLIWNGLMLTVQWYKKTHCLSHNIQSKTRYLSWFLEKSKIWECHSCCKWKQVCFFNGFCALFSMFVCTFFISTITFSLLI